MVDVDEGVRFAHPVERELARLYDLYGIAWQYEPHTIVLERDSEGRVREAFTPDFYLPDLDVYVECTVARQSLTRRKRRKVRIAREQAGVTVGILFRRDFIRIARFRGYGGSSLPQLGGGRLTRGQKGNGRVRMSEASPTPDAGDFWITSESLGGGRSVLTVHGDADLHTAPELRDRLSAAIDEGADAIVLDLTETTFLDSMSLGVLLGAMKRLRARDADMRLVVSRPDVRRIFEITLLDRVFAIDETRETALRSLSDEALGDRVE